MKESDDACQFLNLEEVTRFFLVYLNNIYCAKTHLATQDMPVKRLRLLLDENDK